MKLYIPSIGDQIKLINDWKFNLYPDYRNTGLAKLYDYEYVRNRWIKNNNESGKTNINNIKFNYPNRLDFFTPNISFKEASNNYNEAIKAANILFTLELDKYGKKYIEVNFEKDSILKIDRVYIKKTFKSFDSISFYLIKNKKKVRFWAKLEDVNKIEFEKISE